MERPTLKTGALRVDGTALRDELGRQVLLRGVNAGGRSKFAPFVPYGPVDSDAELARYMDTLAGWGCNALRMPFSWEAIEPERGRIDEGYLARYEAMIDAAWRRGMRVIVDFHQDVYASPFGGDGFPLWTLGDIEHGEPRHDLRDDEWFAQYYQTGGPVPRAFDRLWSNADGILDDFESMWRRMAARLCGRPGVIGFEIINEPGWGSMDIAEFERDVLVPALERLGAAVREACPGALVFGGGPGADALRGTTALTNPALPGFVYAPHFYDPRVALGGPYLDRDKTDLHVRTFAEVGRGWGRPVLFGEFGAGDRCPDKCAYLRHVYGLFDELQAHATIWEVSFSGDVWNHEELTLVNPDGSERPQVREVVRVYPRAVDGVVDRFRWEPGAGRFELDVSRAGDGVTEICAPARCVGDRPDVHVSAGEAEWAGGSVLVRAGAQAYTLTIEGRPS